MSGVSLNYCAIRWLRHPGQHPSDADALVFDRHPTRQCRNDRADVLPRWLDERPPVNGGLPATLIDPFLPSFDWDTWSRFQEDENVFDFREARKTVLEYSTYRPLSKNEKSHLFDVYKLTILFDCIWYFQRGEGHDFYEKRKIDALNRLGREQFYHELFV